MSRITKVALVASVVAVSACSSGASTPARTAPATQAAPSMVATIAPSASASAVAVAPPTAGAAQLKSLSTTNPGLNAKLMESGFGAVWAISPAGLEKISDSGAISHLITGKFADVAVGEKSVFVIDGSTNQLDELSPDSGDIVRHWPLAPGGQSLALSDKAAFVIHSSYPATVDRVDLATGKSQTFTVAEMAGGLIKSEALAYGADVLWTSSDGTTIYGLDPTTLKVTKTAHVPTTAYSVWFGNGSVWTSGDAYHQGIHRVDPATATDVADIMQDAIQVAFSANGVWLSAADGPTEIDPKTAQIVAALPHADIASGYAGGVAILNDKAFVSYVDSGQLQQIQVP